MSLIFALLFLLIFILQQTVRSQELTRRMQPYLWVSLIRSQDPQSEPSSSQSLPHSCYDFPWWYLFSRSKCLGEFYQRTWWHSFLLFRLKYVLLWPCFPLFTVCSMWWLCWLVVLLGRCTWPSNEKFTTVCGVCILFFDWVEVLLISFFSWRWIPDNVSVSLVRVPPVGQTQVYRHAILSLQKSTFVFFIILFSQLLH